MAADGYWPEQIVEALGDRTGSTRIDKVHDRQAEDASDMAAALARPMANEAAYRSLRLPRHQPLFLVNEIGGLRECSPTLMFQCRLMAECSGRWSWRIRKGTGHAVFSAAHAAAGLPETREAEVADHRRHLRRPKANAILQRNLAIQLTFDLHRSPARSMFGVSTPAPAAGRIALAKCLCVAKVEWPAAMVRVGLIATNRAGSPTKRVNWRD